MRDVVVSIRDAIAETTASSLVGLYVYGSLVAGDFDPDVSDVDLVALLADDPSDELAARLATMHDALARKHPDWAGRIEVVYVAAARLRTYREHIPRLAVISPGEPFHVVSGGREWTLTWYPAREEGRALVGPPISALVPEIGREEFLAAVRERLLAFGTIEDGCTRGSCAYAILTVCRGMYTLVYGSRPSKIRAAAWATEEYPQWKGLIGSALAWRKERWAPPAPDTAAVADTRRFVADMLPQVGE